MEDNVVVRSIISPKSKTSWGTWGEWQYCGINAFAVAFQLKIEPYQNKGDEAADDTSLNSIALYCGEQHGIHDLGQRITSSEGPRGLWRDTIYCQDGFFIGGKLKSEWPQPGYGDDTAGTNLSLRCSNGQDFSIEVNGSDWGTWGGLESCPNDTKICGLRTLVAPPGSSDDTSLNAVEFACC